MRRAPQRTWNDASLAHVRSAPTSPTHSSIGMRLRFSLAAVRLRRGLQHTILESRDDHFSLALSSPIDVSEVPPRR